MYYVLRRDTEQAKYLKELVLLRKLGLEGVIKENI